MSINGLYFFTVNLMPYITLILVIVGLSYRIFTWIQGGKTHKYIVKLNLFSFIKEIVLNIFLFKRIFYISRITWTLAILMHLSIFAILFGHLRPFGLWSKEIISWLGKPAEEFLVYTLPTVLGIIFTVAIAGLLFRRLIYKTQRSLSLLDDYWALALLLLIGISGSIMRLSDHLPEEFVVKFLPGIVFRLEHTPPILWVSVHFFLVQLFLIYLPLGKLFHIITAPINILINSGIQLKLAGYTSKTAGFTKRQFFEADSCTSCGICAEVCEVYKATRGKYRSYYGITKFIRTVKSPIGNEKLKLIASQYVDDVFRCLLCGRCKEYCPAILDTVSLGISAREHLISMGIYPKNFDLALDAIKDVRNVLGLPNEERGMWNEYSPTPAPVNVKGAEIVYFVGCMASFSPAVQDIPVAVTQILDTAGVNYTILGGEEWCCGYPLIIGGIREVVKDLITHNINKIKEIGAKIVIFSCPSCYLTWRTEYPSDGLKLLHHTQFIRELIDQGKIKLGRLDLKVTYHDPCDLGRKSGIYDDPREIIRKIPGIKFKEMKYSRNKSLCCGGGGDVEIMDENFPAEVGVQVIEEAEKIGVNMIITACQQCKRTLLKAIKRSGKPMRILDISELVLLSMENAS